MRSFHLHSMKDHKHGDLTPPSTLESNLLGLYRVELFRLVAIVLRVLSFPLASAVLALLRSSVAPLLLPLLRRLRLTAVILRLHVGCLLLAVVLRRRRSIRLLRLLYDIAVGPQLRVRRFSRHVCETIAKLDRRGRRAKGSCRRGTKVIACSSTKVDAAPSCEVRKRRKTGRKGVAQA